MEIKQNGNSPRLTLQRLARSHRECHIMASFAPGSGLATRRNSFQFFELISGGINPCHVDRLSKPLRYNVKRRFQRHLYTGLGELVNAGLNSSSIEACSCFVNFQVKRSPMLHRTSRSFGEVNAGSCGPSLEALNEPHKQERDPRNFFNWPRATDTQKWRESQREIGASGVKSQAAAFEARNEPSSAKTWTDSITGHDWSSYEPPPPSYTELYAPSYMSYGSTQ